MSEVAKIVELAQIVKALDLKREAAAEKLAILMLSSMTDKQIDRALQILDHLTPLPHTEGTE